MNGALLTESADVYTSFFSGPGSFTDIIARSKIAEFHLGSIQPTDSAFPSTINVPGKLGEVARGGAMSFRVLRQDEDDSSIRDTSSEIDVQIRKMLPHLLNGMQTKDPRVLICGKRSIDTCRASISLVNHLLTDSNQELVPLPTRRVAFLDLDFTSPACSAPGTVSVAILQRPVLGTSYTQPLRQSSNGSNRIVSVQYVGAVDTSEVPKIDPNCISTLLSAAKEAIKDQTLVIRTGSWLANMTQTERSHVHKLLRVDLAICIDPSKASPHYEAAQTISEGKPDTVFHLPMSPCPISSLSEHKSMLQSHFQLCRFVDDVPLWYHESIPDTRKRKLVLSTNESNNEIKFLQVRGGMLRPQDIPAAIYQNLVVIVAMSTTNGSEAPLDSRYDDLMRNVPDENNSTLSLVKIRAVADHQPLHYVGLALVEEVDAATRSITLNTPVGMEDIQRCTSAGHEVGLILEKAGTDGRFGRHLLFG